MPETARSIAPVLSSSAEESGPVSAESVEQQCRASVRAELMGPQCRIANPDYDDRCYYHFAAGMTNYVNKVIECVNRGGPGRHARDARR